MNSELKHVWVIDDDPIFTYVIKRIVEMADFCSNLVVFNDADLAFEQIKSNNNGIEFPQIIFLDINMPMLDGWQFLNQISQIELNHDLSIYLVTSSIDSQDHKNSLNYKIVKRLLVKPLSIELLQQIKEEYLASLN